MPGHHVKQCHLPMKAASDVKSELQQGPRSVTTSSLPLRIKSIKALSRFGRMAVSKATGFLIYSVFNEVVILELADEALHRKIAAAMN